MFSPSKRTGSFVAFLCFAVFAATLSNSPVFAGNATEVDVQPGRSSNSRSAGSSDVDAAYQEGLRAIQGVMETMSQEEAERTRRELEQAAEQDRQDLLKKEEQARKNRIQVQKSKQDPTLNPWANKGQRNDEPKTEEPKSMTANQPLDPTNDYDGKPCKYFTKHNDDAHLYYHQDGAIVSYGERVYECSGGRWRYLVNVRNYWANPAGIEASKVENR
ncbi:hypothetical protein OH720_18285 [Pseudomonas sp. WJP1]|uniref:hypothetical protein n=1 Tax=Pseudomonas sp. WJP1 TaxID=2986947 RepID=UPI00234B96C6|nr:hypothetical protein [Pseudomonas sp. WJP1]WCM48960.1 hypothetical protein OH720_18285 [Pseudomonas sp. WJP1]